MLFQRNLSELQTECLCQGGFFLWLVVSLEYGRGMDLSLVLQ